MERAFVLADGNGARFLQEVGEDLGGLDLTSFCLHVDLDELAETRRVHIARSLGIAEGLK